MTPTDPFERLTILERAELLHASTLRRHGEHLDHHAERMDALQRNHDLLITQQADLQRMINRHEDGMTELRQILQAIKDMLPRGNGH